MSFYNGPNIVTNGLTLSYDLADKNSYPGTGTSITDLSGNGYTGTLTNGPTFNSSNGGSLVFDGVNDTVDFSYDLRSTWTYECWVMHNAVSGFCFLGQGTTTTNNGLHIWFYDGSNLRFGMYSNDTDALSLTTSTGIWYQYCFTYNHSSPFTKQIFRNGQKLTTTVVSGPSQYSGTGTVKIGTIYSSGGVFANGRFANVKLYNSVLSDNAVLQNYNANKTRFGLP